MAVHRWALRDVNTSEVFTFPQNPAEMTSPFPARNITVQATTAVDGQTILFEGASHPASWTFAGSCRTPEFYESLRSWVFEHPGRVQVTDHFGRVITCVLTGFDPVPKRSVGVYWRHNYTVTALVLSVGAPTVGAVA